MLDGASQALSPPALREHVKRGLSPAQAAERLARDGPNTLAPHRRRGVPARLLKAARDPMALLLLVAGLVYLLIGDRLDAVIVLLALAPIIGIDFVLEERAERTLERLRTLVAPRVEALRGGKRMSLPSQELVPGDVIFLTEGEIIPADAVVVAGSDLQADESSLTGESLPVVKTPAQEGWEQHNVLRAGTTLLSGRATAMIMATGGRTAYGRIGALVAQAKTRPTPTQRSIAQLVRRLVIVATLFFVGVIAVDLLRGQPWSTALLAGITLAIAAVPEEFSVVYTLYLTLSAWRMAGHHALVRRLTGVETLGSVTTICTDKTGTLTVGSMALTDLYASDGRKAPARGQEPGNAPSGSTSPPPSTGWLLEAAVLASEIRPFDPMEQTILDVAAREGVGIPDLYREWRLVHEYPFDPRRKLVTHIWQSRAGRLRIAVKGAIEGVLAYCQMSEDEVRRVQEENRAMAERGRRVLAVAEGTLASISGARERDQAGLSLRGLIGFTDPPRAGVRESIAECQRAGIKVIMLTGDHPLTAHQIAETVGLRHRDEGIISGEMLERLDDAALRRLLPEIDIMARSSPLQKFRLVRALKESGAAVAMTGDGINDAPALREADVGVAMGRRGTEVAREAATMVLLDDSFSTIVAAVREGRRIYDNLQRAFRYLVAFHVPILLATFLMPLLGQPLLLMPAHIIWLELILHPTASLVFQGDAAAPDIMRRPPRDPRAPFLEGPRAARVVGVGGSLFVACAGLYLLALRQGGGVEAARSLGLTTLILGQMVLVLVERTPGGPFWQAGLRGNWILPLVLGTIMASVLLFQYVPPIAALLRLAPLGPVAWLIAILAAGMSVLWVEMIKVGWRGRPRWKRA